MIYFLLPAYNEEQNIGKILESIKKTFKNQNYKIVLVDDGSVDNTKKIAYRFSNEIPIDIIEHMSNLGLGKTLKDGFIHILNKIKDEDIIITMDADNTHPVELANKMIEKIRENDIVIASRYVGGREVGVNLLRKVLSKGANFLLKLFFFNRIEDYTSGYRAYKGKFLKIVYQKYKENFIEENGFSSTAEILLKALNFKPKIFEVPLILRYDYKAGKSKMKILKNIFSYFKLIYKLKR